MTVDTRLPTAEQMQSHLAAHPPRRPSRQTGLVLLLAMAAMFLLVVSARHALMLLLPWLLLLGISAWVFWRVRRLRRLEQRVNQVQERTMLRWFEPALREAWDLLSATAAVPSLHGRVMATLAHCLEQLGAYDAAIVVYNRLIDESGEAPPPTLRLRRVFAQLQADHLADADDALRHLRGPARTWAGTAAGAAFRLVWLLQLVRTNHFTEAAEGEQDLLDALRPLGVEAAYGHALMALACHYLSGQAAAARARLWWSRATLLMPASVLIARFAELRPLADAPAMQELRTGADDG